jgi:hypothetical protein
MAGAISLTFGSPTAAFADKLTSVMARAVLSAICLPTDLDLRKWSCANAVGYLDLINHVSGQTQCNLTLSGRFYQGEFAPHEYLYLIPYESDCESHATLFGGSLIFAREHGNLVFKQYLRSEPLADYVGETMGKPSSDNCLVHHRPGDGDALFCIISNGNMGSVDWNLAEITLTHTATGYEETGKDDWRISKEMAESNPGVIPGINEAIACPVSSDNEPYFFSLSGLRRAPVADTLAFTAHYVDHATAVAACDHAHGQTPFFYGPIDRRKIKTGTFVYDIASGKLGGSGRSGH